MLINLGEFTPQNPNNDCLTESHRPAIAETGVGELKSTATGVSPSTNAAVTDESAQIEYIDSDKVGVGSVGKSRFIQKNFTHSSPAASARNTPEPQNHLHSPTHLHPQILNSPRTAVRHWLQWKKVRILPNGSFRGDFFETFKDLLNACWLDLEELVAAHNSQIEALQDVSDRKRHKLRARSISKEAIEAVLAEAAASECLKHLESLRETLSCKRASLDELAKFIDALRIPEDGKALYTAVVAQWCLNVKRKLFGLPVRFPLMLVLFGPQGNGKTTAVQQLVSIFNSLRMDLALNQITDPTYNKSYRVNLVVTCDELAGATKTEIDALKVRITGDQLSSRTFRTEEVETTKLRSSFIGTSNKPLNLVLNDSTGMRRFFELHVLSKIDFKVIADGGIDYFKLWQEIDETRLSYLDDVLEQFESAQAELISADEFRSFLCDADLIPADGDSYQTMRACDLYSRYQEWAAAAGYKPVDSGYFGKRIVAAGLKRAPRQRTGAAYLVKAQAPQTIFDVSAHIARVDANAHETAPVTTTSPESTEVTS